MPPIYEARCQDCGELTDYYRSVANRDDTPKCECGGETKKIISRYAVQGDFEPYYDENLETHVKSKQHRKKVMKEQGVSEMIGKGWT